VLIFNNNKLPEQTTQTVIARSPKRDWRMKNILLNCLILLVIFGLMNISNMGPTLGGKWSRLWYCRNASSKITKSRTGKKTLLLVYSANTNPTQAAKIMWARLFSNTLGGLTFGGADCSGKNERLMGTSGSTSGSEYWVFVGPSTEIVKD